MRKILSRNIKKCVFRYFGYYLRDFTTADTYKNDLAVMKTLTPKQMGKVSHDVSKCANSDITVWNAFVESCNTLVELLDSKDAFRIIKAVDTFYENLGHGLRNCDKNFVQKLIKRLIECCEGYNFGDLSRISQIVSNLAIFNYYLLPDVVTLLGKIAILSNLRIAEAIPSHVVRLSVSYSRLGIRDDILMDCLAKFVIMDGTVELDDLRVILTSFSVMGIYNQELLDLCINRHLDCAEIDVNELAILSFVFSRLNYTNERVIRFFEKHLDHCKVENIDVANLCINLEKLNVPIPPNMIESIEIANLDRDTFFGVVPLLASASERIEEVTTKYSEFCEDTKVAENLNVLEFISKSPFEIVAGNLYRRVMSKLPKLEKDEILKLAKIIIKLPYTWVFDYSFDIFDKIGPESIPLECLTEIAILASAKLYLSSGPGIVRYVEDLQAHVGISVSDIVEDFLVKNEKNKVSSLLCAEIQDLVPNEAEMNAKVGCMNVLIRMPNSNVVVIPVYPGDLLQVEEYAEDVEWAPPNRIGKFEFFAKLYYLKEQNVKIAPLTYFDWRKLISREEKAAFLSDLASHTLSDTHPRQRLGVSV